MKVMALMHLIYSGLWDSIRISTKEFTTLPLIKDMKSSIVQHIQELSMTLQTKPRSCFKDIAIKSQQLPALTTRDGSSLLIVEKTLCLLFGTLFLLLQWEHSWTHIQMELSVLTCQLITSTWSLLETTSHRPLLCGTGPMKMKKDPLFRFSSNVPRSSFPNTGSSLTPTTQQNWPLTVVKEFSS